jgi:hypothetical protein
MPIPIQTGEMELDMSDDMVMRSVYLRPLQDTQLRNLAHELGTTKSDLIRSAISIKLLEWLRTNDADSIRADIELGRRDEAAIRSGRRRREDGAPMAVALGKAAQVTLSTVDAQAVDFGSAAEVMEESQEHA